MLRQIAFILALLSPVAALAELSDTEAKKLAINMDNTVTKAKKNLNQLINDGARNKYQELRRSVSAALDAWPAQNLSNRAAFPYFECTEAARSFLQYGDAWNRGDNNKEWRDKAAKQFRKSDAGCKAALKNPDMSLKDIK